MTITLALVVVFSHHQVAVPMFSVWSLMARLKGVTKILFSNLRQESHQTFQKKEINAPGGARRLCILSLWCSFIFSIAIGFLFNFLSSMNFFIMFFSKKRSVSTDFDLNFAVHSLCAFGKCFAHFVITNSLFYC